MRNEPAPVPRPYGHRSRLPDGNQANNPDAGLLAALDELADAERDAGAAMANLYGPVMRRLAATGDARGAFVEQARVMLEAQARVTTMPAQTLDGARAKIRYVLKTWDDGRSGTYMDLPLGALRDALAVGFGVEDTAAPGPALCLPEIQREDGEGAGDLLTRSGLRAAAGGISTSNPDAALLADLVVVVDLQNDRDAAYKNWNAPPTKRRGTRPDAKAAFLRAARAHEAMDLRVINTPARTEAGAVAKLRLALDHLPDMKTGGMFSVPASALLDALVVVFGCARPPPKPPRKQPTRKPK